MSNPTVKTMSLCKSYRIYKKPSDLLKSFFSKNVRFDTFTALDNITFSANRGETLGIIGENGAGKSTLLKIIAGVLPPSSGDVEVNGRVLSILELGVGFHPEFTGLENVYLYGDMLGFNRKFCKDKLNEIIEFSELGLFMDMPLKTYSTGMIMRLAFSIVTSFEPDIIIVDEALSVGDVHFQTKCVNRIIEFKKRGVIILFTSHSTYHISLFCDRVIWLQKGREKMSGSPDKVIPAYEHYILHKDFDIQAIQDHTSSAVVIREFDILNLLPMKRGDDMVFRALVENFSPGLKYHFSISIKISMDRGVYATGTHMTGKEPISGKLNEILVRFPEMPLMGGTYYAHFRVFDETGLVIYHEKMSSNFDVVKESLEGGFCRLQNCWEIKQIS